jgi:hypothetical protein
VARPDAKVARHVREEPWCSGSRIDRDQRVAKFALTRSAHFAAEHVGHQLHAVADTEHRGAELEQLGGALRRTLFRHAARSTREDDADGVASANGIDWGVERHDLGEHRQLSQAPRDELRVLRAEVQNENGLMRQGVDLR